MAEYLRFISEIVWLWHVEEFQRLRNSAIRALGAPLAFVALGVIFGAWSVKAKAVVLVIAMAIASFTLLRASWRRKEIGVEIAAAIEAAKTREAVNLAQILVGGVERYLNFVAGALAGDLAIAFLVLLLPVHQNIVATALVFSVGWFFVVYWVWQGGETWWPRIAKWAALVTLAVALFWMVFPEPAEVIASSDFGFGSALAEIVRQAAAHRYLALAAIALGAVLWFAWTQKGRAVTQAAKTVGQTKVNLGDLVYKTIALGLIGLVAWWVFSRTALFFSGAPRGDGEVVANITLPLQNRPGEWWDLPRARPGQTVLFPGDTVGAWAKFRDGSTMLIVDMGMQCRLPVAVKGMKPLQVMVLDVVVPSPHC